MYLVYVLLVFSVVLAIYQIYGRYKRRSGFIKEKFGPCCFKYVRNEDQQEMRQVIYVGDEEGAITQVGSNFVLVPTNQSNVNLVQTPYNIEKQEEVPNTAPQF